MNACKNINPMLLISGLIGFGLGWLNAQWQWAVEPAQILTGISVGWSYADPFYAITVKGWNICNQIAILLLKAGFSERVASYILSACCGMFTFVCLSVFMWALSEDMICALLSPCIIFFVHGPYSKGLNYAITLLGVDHTYTMVSLSFFLLVVALLALGYLTLGFLLLGFSLAIHPTVGVWLTGIVMVSMVFDKIILKAFLAKHYLQYLLGLFFSGISLWLYFGGRHEVIVQHVDLVPYYKAIITFWTEHLSKFNLLSGAMLRVYLSVILSALALVFLRGRYPHRSPFIFVSFIVCAFMGGLVCIVYWLPLDKVGQYYPVLQLYPGRVFNYNILGALMLVLGLLWRHKTNIYAQFALLVLMLALLVHRSMRLDDSALSTDIVTLAVLYGCSIGLWLAVKGLTEGNYSKIMHKIVSVTVIGCGVLMAGITYVQAARAWQGNQKEYFKDYTNDPLYAFMRHRPGVVLAAPGIRWVLIRTQRPVLFNAGPSILNYVPETGPEIEKILKQAYDFDFLNPPLEALRIGRGIPKEPVRALWHDRSLVQWQELKKELHVTDIIVFKDWSLRLPSVARNDQYILYTIP